MSYCRFGNADAYIFDHVNFGIVCMACALMPATGENDPLPDTFVAGYDRQKMLNHIEEHRDSGHNIPFDVDLRLRKEIKHIESCPCNNADERGCFLISDKTNKCVSCECVEEIDIPLPGHFLECKWDGLVANRFLCQCYYPGMDREYGK